MMTAGSIVGIIVGIIAILLLLAILLAWVFRKINNNSVSEYTSKARMDGKTIIITGATSGIGKLAAFELAGRGARLILGCRNVEKAKIVADEITTSTGNSNTVIHYLDTSILSSVREFAKTILDTEERIDVLILNAGIAGYNKYTSTVDNIEITIATNHFGHFLLTNLLLGLMIKSEPSRIICTASRMHLFLRSLDVEKINISREDFKYSNPYGLSKLCNILFTRYLAHLLQNHNVTVNSMCPGMVGTDIFDKGDAWFTSVFMGFFSRFLARSVEQGVSTLLYLAIDEQVKDVTGKFFVDYKFGLASALSKNEDIMKKVWQKSEEVVCLTEEEKSLVKELKAQLS